jgi:protein gp37
MNKNKSINWPGLTHTFNPVIGCLRGCSKATKGFDCYAAKLHTMRHNALMAGKHLPAQYCLPFDHIQFAPERLMDRDLKKPGPFKIFTGSMTDHCFWPDHIQQEVIDCMRMYKQHTFMMLTKDPYSYQGYDWPDNVMCGTTITFYSQSDYQLLDIATLPSRPFLSVEPLLGRVPEYDYSKFEVVIVGKDNTTGAEPPKREWLDSVVWQVPKSKIWLKQ